jgi:moderate conductance mechanosensitive channel
VTTVNNTNRGLGNAVFSINVSYREDTDRVSRVLQEIAAQMRQESAFQRQMLGGFDLWGVDKVDGATATIAGQIVCTDAGRWPVQREFNRRMKLRFQELGIAIQPPTQAVILQPLGVKSNAEPAAPATEKAAQ